MRLIMDTSALSSGLKINPNSLSGERSPRPIFFKLLRKDTTMSKSEKTSKAVASKAAKILSNPKSSKAAKSVAGSALTQRPNKKK